MNLDQIELHPVKVPLVTRFRRVDWREAVLIRGPEGWGEFSPFPDYPPETTSRWLAAALEAACTPWPRPGRTHVEVNTTIPAVEPERAAEMAAASGCRTAKVKVAEPGCDFDLDLARVAAVREALGPNGRLRIDVNGAWEVDDAVERIRVLARYDLEYVEQPVSTIPEMVEVRKRVGVPIAADESIRRAADPLEVVTAGAADVLVLKPQPLGGWRRLVSIARRTETPVVVSSALETSVGLAAAVYAAASLDELPYAAGLGTATLLAGDVTSQPLVPVGGMVEVRRPVPDLVDRWEADRETASRLLERLRRAAELLT
ncbi:MAG: o-succinylbenzoate synthase [Acidimicrobiia bacterium]|nr:MAG: o-succinylbenzoate synthase [Acidimicrobiia bacterium]